MKCVECGKSFLSFDKYTIHLKYVHDIVNHFVCPVSNCHRLYHMKKDLKKHISSKHNTVQCIPKEEIIHNKICSGSIKNANDTAEMSSCKNKNTDSVIKENKKKYIEPISEEENCESYETVLSKVLQRFVSEHYNNLLLPRNAIQNIIQSVQKLLSLTISMFQKYFKTYCGSCVPSNEFKMLSNMLNFLENQFSSLKTEYKRFRFFEQSKHLIKPTELKIGVNHVEKRNAGDVALHLANSLAYYIPMEKTLKAFLELPNVYETIINYQKDLLNNFKEDGPMSNLIHGSIYQNISKEASKIIFPLVLYFDDFETGNPLGSKAGNYKIGVIYYTIALLPPQFIRRLENIFLALTFYSHDRVLFGNDVMFGKLIQQLQILENSGINICIKNEIRTVYFSVILVLGDNLGLHSILGCTESFSANVFCRICLAPKAVTETQICEDPVIIRNKNNYEYDLFNRVGLKEACVWHQLQQFHMYENTSCDVMHDLYEGIHRYDMALIIKKLISEHFFNLDLLNNRVQYLLYESHEKNVPPKITKDHITNGCIVFSASEMLSLVRNFRFAVGDLVPERNATWNFYLLLLNITDILSNHEISKPTLELLKVLIEEHHCLYLSLFEVKLKPKHHFLLHYPRVIKKIGPPILVSSIRYEGKHKDFKSTAHYLRCRKNLPYSLAIRMQLKCCYRFMSNRGLYEDVNFGLPYKLEKESNESVYADINSNHFFCVHWYEINGVRYSDNNVLLCQISEDIPAFGKIKSILVAKDDTSSIIFLCQTLKTNCYSEHFKSYEVVLLTKTLTISLSNVHSKLPTILHAIPNGKTYVSVSTY